ncbi:hypothetical protein H6P81_004378 [Aristolochia fimbriata]|uniref:YTH domain-containing protein n=1 Tax=Aristolochia fimbriata TaxID=158543 RepID=A0AAV7FF78_ARIFI|nr:hypothetical protein H6P81_004378 [Aristolochia fimbriata]
MEVSGGCIAPEFVYRISTAEEWGELQKNGSSSGGDFDKSSGFIHLSNIDQVMGTLQSFFQGREGLYLLQLDTAKLGEGLVYEAVDESNTFPHFYGPCRSFVPLPLEAVSKAEKLELRDELRFGTFVSHGAVRLSRRGGCANMERYSGSERQTAETYVIHSTYLNQHLVAAPPLEETVIMDNSVGTELVVDQGPYYPAVSNYYGYYCTGFESPSEWEDHYRFFGLDGLDPQYTGLQTEGLPYVYYPPSYGYADSPYNPYNPYIPGAVVALDSPFVGPQQYYGAPPAYQHPVSSPGYVPVLVQPTADVLPNSAVEATVLSGVSSAGGPSGTGVKHIIPPNSAVTVACPTSSGSDQRTHSASNIIIPPSKISGVAQVKSASTKQPSSYADATTSRISISTSSHVNQNRSVLTSNKPAENFGFGRATMHNPLKAPLPVNNGFDFGTDANGWAAVHNLRSVGADAFGEQNRGPRTSRLKNKWSTSIALKEYSTNMVGSNAQASILIYADQYNKEDFPVHYPNAKFFVIKSYSEDDVHKSIKYGVWSSTPAGNKKLDAAFDDARRVDCGEPGKCPVFLFFSVNASGQFCGVAEMMGPVDYEKDMDFWQQDKWSGSFPVKWHIVKDVPNSSFRHVILENNENKPVTNSRDTQEIWFSPGTEMLKIFKNYSSKTSLLDDFMYYEERQKIRQEEKLRLLKSYESSFFVPSFVPVSKANVTISQPLKRNENLPKQNEKNILEKKSLTVGDQTIDKQDVQDSSLSRQEKVNEVAEESKVVSSIVKKINSLSIDSLEGSVTRVSEPVSTGCPVDVVTVGSMPVRVNGFNDSNHGILTIGTISIDPKSVRIDK